MDATWHWGHVADPRGPTRTPTWRMGDTWALFIFIYIYRSVIVHIVSRLSGEIY